MYGFREFYVIHQTVVGLQVILAFTLTNYETHDIFVLNVFFGGFQTKLNRLVGLGSHAHTIADIYPNLNHARFYTCN